MFKRIFIITLVVSVMLGFLPACTAAPKAESQAATAAPDTFDENLVSASGKVVATKFANLSFLVGAQEIDLYVKPGDMVKDGDIVARLSEDALPESIILADADILNARRTLDEILISQAPKFSAEQVKVQAEKAVEDAKEALADVKGPVASETEINRVRAELAIAYDDLEDAQEDYDDVKDRAEGDVYKAQAIIALSNVQTRIRDLTRTLNDYLGANDPFDVAEAEATLALAEAKLADAMRDYERVKDGPDPDKVSVAEANIKAYESIINQKMLIAPFDGTIVESYAQSGEAVTPGMPVVLLADLSTLIIQSTDLSEVDVARLKVGDVAKVSFDALPNVTVNGKIARIALKNASGSGVYYTIDIVLDETPEALRWGMSAFIEITVE